MADAASHRASIAAAVALWALVVRWVWRAHALERLLSIGPVEGDPYERVGD